MATETNNKSTDNGFRVVDGVDVDVKYKCDSPAITDDEIRAYIKRGNLNNPNSVVRGLFLELDNDDIEITYDLEPVNFERIRRITGYLVGTMDR